MLNAIRKAWGWIGLEPAEVVVTNSFGNLIVCAVDGGYWRISPEEWLCEKIAHNADEFANLSMDDEFRIDWQMTRLVELAQREVGPLTDGKCYCLKLPAAIGGSYEASNLGTITLTELILFAGDMAEQIRNLPDGYPVQVKIL